MVPRENRTVRLPKLDDIDDGSRLRASSYQRSVLGNHVSSGIGLVTHGLKLVFCSVPVVSS